MSLPIPKYIGKARISDAPIQHTWDDEDSEPMYQEDRRLANRIRVISSKGTIALTAGFAEWITYRFAKYSDDPVLDQFIEAVWAGMVDWSYLRPVDDVPGVPDETWTGPVRGPIWVALSFLDEVVNGAKGGRSTALSSSCLSQLALNVMPDPTPYKEWRRFVIGRLRELCPRGQGDDLGPAVPREVLDPELDYRPESGILLIRRYLQTLDYRRNPFLCSPEEMIKKGFVGVPYTI